MTQSSDTQALGMWLVSSLRATTFINGEDTFDKTTIWNDVVGDPPDEEHNRPRTGEFVQTGMYKGWGVLFRVRPGRVDWVFNFATQDLEDVSNSPMLSGGPAEFVLESFSELTSKWLEVCPHSNRLAFGALLVQRVEDSRSGLIIMDKYLPGVEIDPDNSTDFFYQINRPLQSAEVEGLVINRLTKWSVVRVGLANVNLSLTENPRAMVSTGQQIHGCTLELDINTALDSQTELQQTKLAAVFLELMSIGKDIAVSGDLR